MTTTGREGGRKGGKEREKKDEYERRGVCVSVSIYACVCLYVRVSERVN